MPYKSEKIPIEGTKYDRRVVLTPQQKDKIRWLYENETGWSWQKLADRFGCSKSLIGIIINPERQEKIYRAREARGGWRRYYNKDAWREQMKEHRRYKQKLYINKQIGGD